MDSSDQTTRLFAEWRRDGLASWHEFSRPQIHGYDLNCIDVLDPLRFISGADEKLLRVFEQPKSVAGMLQRLCGIEPPAQMMPDAASIPVLGLSNKATANEVVERPPGLEPEKTEDSEEVDSTAVPPAPGSATQNPILDLGHPPIEDYLARHTLWPESEKLYGHGYEISALACGHDGTLVATACRASSEKHAVIRIYETQDWRQVEPPLMAHSLTVTRLRFSCDDRYLLSVGRDRQWALFRRDEQESKRYFRVSSNPKGHSRMILDAAWAPVVGERRTFVTASRDKSVSVYLIFRSSDHLHVRLISISAGENLAILGNKQIRSGRSLQSNSHCFLPSHGRRLSASTGRRESGLYRRRIRRRLVASVLSSVGTASPLQSTTSQLQ